MPADTPSLVPQPAHVSLRDGSFRLTADTKLVAWREATAEAEFLAATLERSTGWRLPLATHTDGPGIIAFNLDPRDTALGDEGYRLTVSPERIDLAAATAAGLFYAQQTLLQLLPPDVYRTAVVPGIEWTVPAVEIVDTPRFAWRGLMLDPARHFIPKADVLRFVDALALHKLNRLHLHLTDDQGWRIEIRRYPRLAEHSGWRPETLVGHYREQPWKFDGVPHGGYYTQDDLREIVAYAARRHIVVVPEIEMPGHNRAMIAAYPEVGCFPEEQAGCEPWGRWGISDDVIAPRAATIEFCQHILAEVIEIFPSPWIHIGGDEAPRTHWQESGEIQTLIRSLGLPDEDHLQAWFTTQIGEFLAAHGRRLLGWDEILEGGLAPGATVMSWRGEKGGIAAASAGHEVVMTPSPWVYLDNCQGPQSEERVGIGGYVSLAKTYSYDPLPAELPADKHHFILGLQGNLWSEYLPHPRHVEYMAFPRGAAVAEIDWSPAASRDFASFLHRFHHHQDRLQALGVNYRPLARRVVRDTGDGRLVGSAETAMLHGNAIRRLPDGLGHLGEWTTAESFATWECVVAEAGLRPVTVTLACSAAAAGTRFAVDVAGQTLEAVVPDTGGWDSYLALAVGLIRVPAGRQLVVVRALDTPTTMVMNLLSVSL